MRTGFSLLLSILLVYAAGCKKSPEPDEENPYIPTEGDLGDAVINKASIEGYADKRSYFPGDEVRLMLSSAEDSLISLTVYRIGLNDEVIMQDLDITISRQDYFKYSYSYGCDWKVTHTFQIPHESPSGMYTAVAKNQSGNTEFITFIVKEGAVAAPSDILVFAPTNTWQAYNLLWGGASFYRYGPDGETDEEEAIRHSVIVSFRRPNKVDRPFGDEGHLTASEAHLLRWLERKGHDYAMICDEDLHYNPNALQGRIDRVCFHEGSESKFELNLVPPARIELASKV